jgi:hypothetical protein
MDWSLTYGSDLRGLDGFTDADGASQEHRHAISGYAMLIDRGAVSWSSKKQELMTLSTTESEYVTATHAAKEVIWLRRFIGEVFRPLTHPTSIYSDSQTAIALTKDGSYLGLSECNYITIFVIIYCDHIILVTQIPICIGCIFISYCNQLYS